MNTQSSEYMQLKQKVSGTKYSVHTISLLPMLQHHRTLIIVTRNVTLRTSQVVMTMITAYI